MPRVSNTYFRKCTLTLATSEAYIGTIIKTIESIMPLSALAMSISQNLLANMYNRHKTIFGRQAKRINVYFLPIRSTKKTIENAENEKQECNTYLTNLTLRSF